MLGTLLNSITLHYLRIHPLSDHSNKIVSKTKIIRTALDLNQVDDIQAVNTNEALALCLLDQKSGTLSVVHATNGESVSSYNLLYLTSRS